MTILAILGATIALPACDDGGAAQLAAVSSGAQSSVTLSGLSLSSGALSPTFSSGGTNYSVSVPNATTSLTVTPTASASGSTVTVNGVDVTGGTSSGAIGLAVGQNTIIVIVTAADGSSAQTYTVNVTRASA